MRPKLIVHLGSATVIGLLSIFAFDFAYSSRIGVGLDTLPARCWREKMRDVAAVACDQRIEVGQVGVVQRTLCNLHPAMVRPVQRPVFQNAVAQWDFQHRAVRKAHRDQIIRSQVYGNHRINPLSDFTQ